MKKLAKDHTVLSDAEEDEMMLHLEAINAETGNIRVFKIMELIMKETAENKIQDSLRLKGKKFSAEHNEKIRQARTGVPRPDVTAWNNRRWAAIRAAKAATHGA